MLRIAPIVPLHIGQRRLGFTFIHLSIQNLQNL
jgi:hypothetical protein